MGDESVEIEELHGSQWALWARESNEATLRRLALGMSWGTHLAGSSFGPGRCVWEKEDMWEESGGGQWEGKGRMGKGEMGMDKGKGYPCTMGGKHSGGSICTTAHDASPVMYVSSTGKRREAAA